MKPRKHIICDPRFELETKLVRLKLNSNCQYFAFLINSQSKNTARAKALSTGGNCYNSSSWREGFERKLDERRETERPKKTRSKRR